MNSIFDDLYYGRVGFVGRPCSPAYDEAKGRFQDLDRTLDQLLDRSAADQLFSRGAELEDIAAREAFAAGVRLGGRFVLELLTGSP